jgi:anaerobic magnesium-protoporphyrin IX monomethyl ester cyclase
MRDQIVTTLDAMTDCLLVGHNDYDFKAFTEAVRAAGAEAGAFRDLNLAFVEHEGKPLRCLDLLSELHQGSGQSQHFENTDFLWPAITYLGSYLHRHGFSFDWINQFHLEKETFKEKLQNDDLRTIAITTTLYVAHQPISEIVSFIRRYNDRVKIILGGPYIDTQARLVGGNKLKSLFKFLGADYYVISQEGEETLANLLHCLKSGDDPSQVPNLAYFEGTNFIRTKEKTEANSIEENPVDYSLFPDSELGEFVSTRTSKSCPFACAFCAFPERAGAYRYTGIGDVEKELNALNDRGITTLTFLDDTFNVPKKRFQELLKMMARNRYDFQWNSFYRSDHGDAETIELMGKAQCEGVFLGMESASDRILKLMNKTARRKDYQEAIPRFRDQGILTYASLIVGYPGDNLESHEETVAFIDETKPDFYRGQLWYASPLTPIYRQADSIELRGRGFNWEHHTMDSATACDLVDKMFKRVKSSVWLPQNGFEQWSTYYLQRKGMSRDQLKEYLRTFNQAVEDKLDSPSDRNLKPERLEALEKVSQF